MRLVIDENNIVRSIWSGNIKGIKKKKEYRVVDCPGDWCGKTGDSIDEFNEDWTPKDEYLKRIHAQDREIQQR